MNINGHTLFIMKRIIFIIVFIMLSSGVHSAPMVEIHPSHERTSRSSFAEDHLDLILTDQGRVKDTYYFYSSYGQADAQLIQDYQGAYYVLLRHGVGRGTHVRSEYITIYKVFEKLNELITFPVNGPAGMTSTWEYTYVIRKPESGGLEFTLTLQILGKDAETYPEDTVRMILIK